MDFGKIASDAVVSSGRVLLSIARGLVVIPIITKLLGADAFGIWTSLLAAVTLFVTVGGFHLHGALIRYAPRDDDGTQAFADTLLLGSGSAALFGILFFAVISVLPASLVDGTVDLVDIAPVGALLVALRIQSTVLLNYSRAMNRVKRFEALLVVRTVLETVALVGLLLLTQDLVAAIVGLVVATLVLNVALLVVQFPGWSTLPDPSRFGRYLRYGLPMVPKEISSSLLAHSDKFLIIYLISPTATGIYAVSYSITALFPRVTNLFNSTLYPNVAAAWDSGEVDDLRRLYRGFLRGYALLATPALAGLTLLSFPLIRLLSTTEIARSGWFLVPILGLGFVFRGVENPLTYVLTATEETGRIGYITVVAVVFNLALNLALIPTVGLVGAAVATVCAQVLKSTYFYYRARRVIDLAIPVRDISRAVLATLLMGGLLLFLPVSLDWQVTLLVYPLIGVVVYATALLLLGGVSRRELRRVYMFII
jgi:O-antigen/teichoic acid export membrane protein